MRSAEEILQDKKYYVAAEADVLVVGAGHAGIEAAVAATKMGKKVVLFTLSLDALANLPCNPNIGGSAKGQLTREIAAMGGLMPEIADRCGIQFRMLNRSKGPAVRAPRAQMDRRQYQVQMKHALEKIESLQLIQAEVAEILGHEVAEEDWTGRTSASGGPYYKVEGLVTKLGTVFLAPTVIVTTGTYLDADIVIGESVMPGGPDHQQNAVGLADSLAEFAIPLMRFKTGTPVRVNKKSLDLSQMEVQDGDPEPWTFGYYYGEKSPRRDLQEPCYITWTGPEAQKIIEDNIDRSPLYSGVVKGIGPRYCPSFEDKIVKFPDRKRHQLFIEPMEDGSEEMYVQGLSSSMPVDVQMAVLHSIPGLEKAKVQRMGYAIEYTCLDPTCLDPSLQIKHVAGLFSAGQMNGTSGYEEAAGQGLVAGVNSVLYLEGKAPFLLDRSEAYIGVLIDDLVTEGTKEPYRMMSSRAEYRLILRHDNADLRLTEKAYQLGLVSQKQYERFSQRREKLEKEKARLEETRVRPTPEVNQFLEKRGTAALEGGMALADLLKRPEISYLDLAELDPLIITDDPQLSESVENDIKYEGYIRLEEKRIEKFRRMEERSLPDTIDYNAISGLRLEARQKLSKIRPLSIGQAGRISGVSPADIAVLLVYLESLKDQNQTKEDPQ